MNRSAASLFLLLSIAPRFEAAERVDNVLAQLVPADSNSLFGARMDQLRQTPLYQKLMAQQKVPQLETFAKETGFDPRRDVRELLVASNDKPKSGVLLARGTFRLTPEAQAKLKDAKLIHYRGYNIYAEPNEDAGFCILDPTLAIAGHLPSLRAALDQYKAQNKTATAALLSKAAAIPQQAQIWAVSLGGANFIANNMPMDGSASNFGQIFRSIENTSFQADLSNGLHGFAHGDCRTEADAKSLGDAARGLVGFGRLSVPDNQPELLRLWDGIQVEQRERSITIRANVPQELIDKLVQFFGASGNARPKPPFTPRKLSGSLEGESHLQESKSRPH